MGLQSTMLLLEHKSYKSILVSDVNKFHPTKQKTSKNLAPASNEET